MSDQYYNMMTNDKNDAHDSNDLKKQEKNTTYQVSGMDYSEPKTIPCAICSVPLGNHGTACGWENASIKCNMEMIIVDANHPGFGKNLNAWKREYFNSQEKEESQNELWDECLAFLKYERDIRLSSDPDLHELINKIEAKNS